MPDFPPMLRGIAVRDPRAAALDAAREGCEGGTIFWCIGDVLEAAVVLAPDVPLKRAVQTLPLTAVALRDALGAIGPAELPVHLTWDARILLNGAEAGRVRILAPDRDGAAIPDWIVAHLTVRFRPDDAAAGTALLLEGCGDVDPLDLLGAWSRHLMHRLTEWEDAPHPLHADLTGASWERASKDAAFLGLSEEFGRLRRDGDATRLDPLTDLLETP